MCERRDDGPGPDGERQRGTDDGERQPVQLLLEPDPDAADVLDVVLQCPEANLVAGLPYLQVRDSGGVRAVVQRLIGHLSTRPGKGAIVDCMKTLVIASIAALAAGFVGSASADAPPTLDERVAALEHRVNILELDQTGLREAMEAGDEETAQDTSERLSLMAGLVAPAANLARCINTAEGVRIQWATVNGKRVRIIIDNLDDKAGEKGVTWLPLLHPDCIRDKESTRRKKTPHAIGERVR